MVVFTVRMWRLAVKKKKKKIEDERMLNRHNMVTIRLAIDFFAESLNQ